MRKVTTFCMLLGALWLPWGGNAGPPADFPMTNAITDETVINYAAFDVQ